MSQHRSRNIFTLGNFHLNKQRSTSEARKRICTNDPFERDPFKIQSYNFRYAERPTYPVRPTPRQQEQPQTKQFDTFYYNQDFAPAANNPRASRCNPYEFAQGSPSKYQENRRRKFLQNRRTPATQHNPILGTSSPYSTSLNSSINFQCQSSRQPLSNSSLLRHSFADNFLEQKKLQSAASSLGMECHRNLQSSYPERNGSSTLLRQALNNSYLEFADRNSRTESSFADTCKGTNSSLGNDNRGGSKLPLSLSGSANSNTHNTDNANQYSSLSSMRPNISHSSFMEQPKWHSLDPTTSSAVYPNSRAIKKKPLFTTPSNHFHSSVPSTAGNHQSLICTSRSPCSKRNRSSSSGCEININIKNLEDNLISDNVTIKIERDPMEENLDVPPPTKKLNLSNNLPSYSITPNIKFNTNAGSSPSFAIDKRLSKFDVAKHHLENSPSSTNRFSTIALKNANFSKSSMDARERAFNNPLGKNLRERTKTLSSIYAPQSHSLVTRRSSIPRCVPSTERMPSMVPWSDGLKTPRKLTSENLKGSKDHRSKGNLPYSLSNLSRTSKSSRISDISTSTINCNANRVNNFMKSTNSKIYLKSIILQKFHSSKNLRQRSQPVQLNNGGALPSVSENSCRSKHHSQKLYCSRTKKLNWSKLPFKININVFAEKVKLLRA